MIASFAVLLFSFMACNNEREALQQETDMGKTIDSLSCAGSMDWFSRTAPIYLINKLDDLKRLHESSMMVFGKKFTVIQIRSNEVPDGKYLLTPQTPPIDYFLMVSVRVRQQNPTGGINKYLTIEKVCE